jgi:hypothetical protein
MTGNLIMQLVNASDELYLETQERSGQGSHLLLQPGVLLNNSLILLLQKQIQNPII